MARSYITLTNTRVWKSSGNKLTRILITKIGSLLKWSNRLKLLFFSGPCDSINNWNIIRRKFWYDAATLWAHEISKMMSQTKIVINDEVNVLLLGKGSNKRISTGETKVLRALKLGGP